MRRVLKVAPSDFYAWRTRGPSARAATDAQVLKAVRVARAESAGIYGAPRWDWRADVSWGAYVRLDIYQARHKLRSI